MTEPFNSVRVPALGNQGTLIIREGASLPSSKPCLQIVD
jgi:hypothetical protein